MTNKNSTKKSTINKNTSSRSSTNRTNVNKSNSRRKNNKKSGVKVTLPNILVFTSILASGYLIYQVMLLGPIEKSIRYIIVGIIIAIDLFLFYNNYKLIRSKKKSLRNNLLFCFAMFLFVIVNFTLGFFTNKFYSYVSGINKSTITYSSSLITKSSNKLNDINDISNSKIGLLNDSTSIENYTIPSSMINRYNLLGTNDIVKYDDISTMLHDLYTDNIDYMFISSNYKMMFGEMEEFSNISNDVKIIKTEEKKYKKDASSNDYLYSDGNSITKPFTLLLMGVDSEVDGLSKNAGVHGDSLILITFNPSTLNATMVTIPRDSYVPIQCFKDKRRNKLTHAAWYGSNCMLETIEAFTGIKIDYYVKINFKGLVRLVNAVDGVEVDVPKRLCTDSSDRTGEVCIEKGLQTLDGEGALVFARNRYDLPNGDLDRGQNQQKLVKALISKFKDIKSLDKLNKILDAISDNLDTNLTTKQILSFYNIGKDMLSVGRSTSGDIVNIQSLYIQGTGQIIYDPHLKLSLWNYIVNKDSLNDVIKQMKCNLDDGALIKAFDYSYDDTYSIPVVGYGPYKNTTYIPSLPNFIGKSKEEAVKYLEENKVKYKLSYVKDLDSEYDNGDIIYQSYPVKTALDTIDTLNISVLDKPKGSNNTSNNNKDCSDSDNTNKVCYLPNFVGKDKDYVEQWSKTFSNTIKLKYNEISISLYPNRKIGTIVSQNYVQKTHLSKVKVLELTVITE